MFELSKMYLDKDIHDCKREDIGVLQDIIVYHSDLYYNAEAPIMSDFEYDQLLKKLAFLEEKFQVEEKKSHHVGTGIVESSFEKVAHSRPMISLDNTYNDGELCDFDVRVKKALDTHQTQENIDYTLEFKFDGLGIELIYH